MKTSTELLTPEVINEMSLEECNAFFEDNLRKRSPYLQITREVVRNRIRDIKREIFLANKKARAEERARIKTANHQQVIERRFTTANYRIEAMYQRIHNLWLELEGSSDSKLNFLRKHHARSIANDIHDLPHVHLGLSSIESTESIYKPTFEHFWPRSTVSGFIILDQILLHKDRFTIDMLVGMLFSFCQVVSTTKEENKLLERYQKSETFDNPKQSYNDAGLKLIRTKEYVPHETWARILVEHNLPEIPPYSFGI